VIWIVVGASAAVVLAVGLAAVQGRTALAPLPSPVTTTPPLALPKGRDWSAAQLGAVRFDTALRGYDPGRVDAHLGLWSDWLDVDRHDSAGPHPAPPDTTDLAFPMVLRGYRMDQVDALLDALATLVLARTRTGPPVPAADGPVESTLGPGAPDAPNA
jgi:DivIVA domain-containing protein